MAKKKTVVNKSALIRDYLAANPDAGPKAVVAAIRKKGVNISEALVSFVKYKSSGKKKRRRRKKKAVAAAKPAVSDRVSISTLVQAKKLAEQMGGIEKAKAALAALAKLQ